MVLAVARSAATFMFGTKLFRSSRFVTAWVCSVAALSAVTAIGTFCRSSENRRAVTTTSWMLPLSAALWSASAAAAAPATNKKDKVNAAQKLLFMLFSPKLLVFVGIRLERHISTSV